MPLMITDGATSYIYPDANNARASGRLALASLGAGLRMGVSTITLLP